MCGIPAKKRKITPRQMHQVHFLRPVGGVTDLVRGWQVLDLRVCLYSGECQGLLAHSREIYTFVKNYSQLVSNNAKITERARRHARRFTSKVLHNACMISSHNHGNRNTCLSFLVDTYKLAVCMSDVDSGMIATLGMLFLSLYKFPATKGMLLSTMHDLFRTTANTRCAGYFLTLLMDRGLKRHHYMRFYDDLLCEASDKTKAMAIFRTVTWYEYIDRPFG